MAGERAAQKEAASNGKQEPVSDIERLIAQQSEERKDLGGFEQVTTNIDAFYRPIIEVPIPGVKDGKREVKCEVQGIPIERRERPRNPSEPEKKGGTFYLVKVTREMLAVTDKPPVNGFRDVIALKPGDIVWVDQRYDFRLLDRCIPHYDHERKRLMGAEFYARPTEKINLRSGGKTKWNFDVRAKLLDEEQLKAHGFGGFGTFAERRALPAAATSVVEADPWDSE